MAYEKTSKLRHSWATPLVLGALLLGSSLAVAATETYPMQHGTVSFELPKKWQDARYLYGAPLSLLGPMEQADGGRPVIIVSSDEGSAANLNTDEFTKGEAEYQKARKEFVDELGGKTLKFTKYKQDRFPSGSEVHSMGYRFSWNDIEYVENSYYVTCKKNLYHLKTLLRSTHEKDYADETQKIVKSFKCE